MMDFDIRGLVPRFIWNDKNGHALAKAMEAGLKDFLAVCKTGLDTWGNVENMPEWRLDEMAWEYNIPYDHTADVEIKRKWIKDVFPLSRMYGTPEGIIQYLGAYFDDAVLEENWQYDGDPYHFRLNFTGGWTPEKVAWATNAIKTVKNVRSVLDKYHFMEEWTQKLRAGCAFYGMENGEYTIRKEDAPDLDYYADEDGDMLLDENGLPLIVED